MRRAALLALVAGNVAAKEWSLKEFLVGEWALEKQQPDGNGRIEYAHYSFDAKDNNLVGSYWEEDDDGNKIKEKIAHVEFDDVKSGRWQLGDKPTDKEDPSQADEEDPSPVEMKTLFEFNFQPQNNGHFQVSYSSKEQFIVTDEDSFILTLTKATASQTKETALFTAIRVGESRRKPPPVAKRSLLQRYGWYIFVAILYFAYQAAKEMATKAAAGLGPGKKSK